MDDVSHPEMTVYPPSLARKTPDCSALLGNYCPLHAADSGILGLHSRDRLMGLAVLWNRRRCMPTELV